MYSHNSLPLASGVGGYLKVGGIIGKARRAAAGGPKGRRAGGVLGEGAASPFPPARGSGERCKLPQWGPGEAPAA